MKNLNCLIDCILYQIFRLFWVYHQKHETVTGISPIRIHVNKIKNRITFKTKTGHYLELLTPETMKLIESTKSKIGKIENSKNALYSEITEVVLIHYNIVNNGYL